MSIPSDNLDTVVLLYLDRPSLLQGTLRHSLHRYAQYIHAAGPMERENTFVFSLSFCVVSHLVSVRTFSFIYDIIHSIQTFKLAPAEGYLGL